MAKVICNMKCKHRSKKPLRTYKYKSGEKCYGCTLDAISVSRIFDPDDYVVEVVDEKNMAQCSCYEPIEEDGHAARQFVHKAYESYSVKDGEENEGRRHD